MHLNREISEKKCPRPKSCWLCYAVAITKHNAKYVTERNMNKIKETQKHTNRLVLYLRLRSNRMLLRWLATAFHWLFIYRRVAISYQATGLHAYTVKACSCTKRGLANIKVTRHWIEAPTTHSDTRTTTQYRFTCMRIVKRGVVLLVPKRLIRKHCHIVLNAPS